MKTKNYFPNVKRISFAVIFSAAMLSTAPLRAQDTTTGLKLHYSFETTSGTSVTDDSGNGANGELYGNAAIVPGKEGNGVQFPVLNDFILLPNEITSSFTDFTFAAWVRMDGASVKTQTRIFDFGVSVTSGDPQKYMVLSSNGWNGVPRFSITIGSYQNELGIESNKALPLGTWTHMAVTIQGGTATMYMNGAIVAQATGWNIKPSDMGSTDQNYLAKSQWAGDNNDPNSTVDDVRIYDRALTSDDIASLLGLSELKKQQDALTLGDISAVQSDISLPFSMGTDGVTVKWTSSNPFMIDSLGHLLSRPAKYNTPVLLTALLSKTINGEVYTLPKEFTATITALNPVLTSELVANWNFSGSNIYVENDTVRVKDASESGFVGKLMDVARIRTIGNSTKYHVLDLGENKGYFDMGAGIGEAIYSLNDYTISAYYRIDSTYANLNSWGNALYAFSNSMDALASHDGTMYSCLKVQNAQITSGAWNNGGEQGVSVNSAPTVGTWHHIAYTQKGNTGTVFIDGEAAASGTVTWHPFNTLRKDGFTGTPYNFIGRPPYHSGGDVYLQKTLVYGFQVYNAELTADDMISYLGVKDTIAALNNAYAENPEYIDPDLNTEKEALNLGDLSAITSDLTLPTKGSLDETISISWKSSNNKLITNTGVVTRPDYYNYNDTLTATLSKNGSMLTKAFYATVLLKPNSQFNNDLLVRYDFTNVTDSIVTDVAEKHFNGTLKNDARVQSIGLTTKYNVLNLGDSIGYFDLGPEVGKLMYNLSDYTISAYYRIDSAYTNLSSNGNFLFSFSNGKAELSDRNGYLVGSLRDQGISITPNYYPAASGNQSLSAGSTATIGGWHHFAYTQNGTTGTVYIDGVATVTGIITNSPNTTLPKPNQLGTLYNWIGRSCYEGDAYLRKTLIYDFRLYSKALLETEIKTDVLNVESTISLLDGAYAEDATSVKKVSDSYYLITSTEGKIRIAGLSGKENVTILDITGRQLKSINNLNKFEFAVRSGVYLVKIGNHTTKVIVK